MSKKPEKLAKGWKEVMLAAAGATAMPHIPGPPQLPAHAGAQAKPPVTPNDYNVPWGKHPRDRFLNSISFLESSSGKFLDHQPGGGMHGQDRAIGAKAIMPKTAKNVGAMLASPQSALRSHLGPHYRDPDVEAFAGMDEDKISAAMKADPQLYLRTARYLADHLHVRHKGDDARAAFGWRFGSNIPSDKITDDHLKGSGYVKKFLRHYNALPDATREIAVEGSK